MDEKKPVYDMTDFEYAKYLETLAQDLEEAGNSCTSADVYEAMRRIKVLCGAYKGSRFKE